MQSESLLTLRNNPKLEVVVCRNAPYTVFAYFPMHRRRRILRVLKFVPRPETKVLLVLSEPAISEQDVHVTENQLRDHLGTRSFICAIRRRVIAVPMHSRSGATPVT